MGVALAAPAAVIDRGYRMAAPYFRPKHGASIRCHFMGCAPAPRLVY
jgi:hypothetical protein